MGRKNRYKTKKSKKILLVLIFIILLIVVLKNTVFKPSDETELVEEQSLGELEASGEISGTEDSMATEEEAQIITYQEPEEDEDIKEYIESVMLQYGLDEENFGFFYYNMDNQTYYFFNEDTWFTAASTIKVPLAMMYYDKINAGEITENTTYMYYSYDYEAGAGLTAYTYSAGDRIPVSFLLEQMIVNSDNTATNILITGIR